MGLGLQGAYALQSLDDLLQRRKAEQLAAQLTAEKIRQFNVGADERKRAHDLETQRHELDRAQRGDILTENARLRQDASIDRFAAGQTPPMDLTGSPMVKPLQERGFIRSSPEQQAQEGAGVLQTPPGAETPPLYQAAQDQFTGGAGYHAARTSAAERAAQASQAASDMEGRRAAGAADTADRQQKHDEMMKAMKGQSPDARPYFQMQPTYDAAGVNTGALKFNARTGQLERIEIPGGDKVKPPPGSIGKDIVGQEVATTQLERLKGLYKPEYSGPLAGRLNTLSQVIPGTKSDEGFAQFSASTAAFRNSVIKAITGAQMSEPEANRIRQQIPEITDKPEVWQAKYEQSKKNLADLEQRVQHRNSGATPAKRTRYDLDGNVIQ